MTRAYRSIPGESLSELPAPLRRFHEDERGALAVGRMKAGRGPGLLQRWVCALLRLPREGEVVQTVLQVMVEQDRERWQRFFDGKRLSSTQRAERGRLLERFGPYTFGYRLSVKERTLEYRFERAWLPGVPLPRWLSIRSAAEVLGDEKGWETESRVSVPVLGEVVRYRGRMEPG